MKGWKRVLGFAAMFVAMALVAMGAKGEAKRGARAGGGEGRSREGMKAATAAVAQFVAKEVGLTGEKAGKFVAAYVAEREAGDKRTAEARKGGDREAAMKVYTENRKSLEGVLSATLTPEQAKKAQALMGFGGLESRVAVLLQAKVEASKIEQALPVLAKYNAASSEMFAKVRDNQMSREDATAKRKELSEATLKELAPIVGEDNAKKCLEASGMGGGRFGGGGGTPAAGGERRQKGEGKKGAAPVAP